MVSLCALALSVRGSSRIFLLNYQVAVESWQARSSGTFTCSMSVMLGCNCSLWQGISTCHRSAHCFAACSGGLWQHAVKAQGYTRQLPCIC